MNIGSSDRKEVTDMLKAFMPFVLSIAAKVIGYIICRLLEKYRADK